MIPAQMTSTLLKCLLNDLITQNGEPDYNRYRVMDLVEKRYDCFLDLLVKGEDDLSIIMSLLEKDPDCGAFDPVKRLQALVDYVQIACAIYETGEITLNFATIH